ncbi:MAG: SCO family protein [Sedimenticola sp.]|nr:SCO family protein [Sedimenticola sp.]
MKRVSVFGLVIVLAGLLVWVLFFWHPEGTGHATLESPQLDIAEAPRGGDFVLNSYQGPVDLSDLRGKVVVLYFGYTWCPDVCPTSLGMLSVALEQLSAEEQEQVQVLFISVDPERDSLQHLKEYGEYFHPRILGVTGSHEELTRVAALYGAAYRHADKKSDTDYVVDHSADLYIIDRRGALDTILRHGSQPQQILSVLQSLLQNN